jgi:alkylation response protein AidB-like acyl-CoA dehydrogenase
VQAIRFARVCVEEAMRYSFKRKTFGKALIEHPVIRFKLAQMARQVEASHAWLEYITSVQCTADINSHDEQCGGYLLQFSFHDER